MAKDLASSGNANGGEAADPTRQYWLKMQHIRNTYLHDMVFVYEVFRQQVRAKANPSERNRVQAFLCALGGAIQILHEEKGQSKARPLEVLNTIERRAKAVMPIREKLRKQSKRKRATISQESAAPAQKRRAVLHPRQAAACKSLLCLSQAAYCVEQRHQLHFSTAYQHKGSTAMPAAPSPTPTLAQPPPAAKTKRNLESPTSIAVDTPLGE